MPLFKHSYICSQNFKGQRGITYQIEKLKNFNKRVDIINWISNYITKKFFNLLLILLRKILQEELGILLMILLNPQRIFN